MAKAVHPKRTQSGSSTAIPATATSHRPAAQFLRTEDSSASLLTLVRKVIGSDQVRRWRFEQLLRAGYPEGEAFVLSGRGDVDLHQAIRLLRERCAVPTAMQILI